MGTKGFGLLKKLLYIHLQADDLGIVRKDTISTATEELMISTPGYWLSPCLVALAAWINDMPTLAEKALREGINRNDEKTSLFWALICRRADRKAAALKWTQRYLANQDEENLDRKTVIILDAFASGLLGADSEGIISKQMTVWLEHLADKPGFVEHQTQQWSDAINLKRKPLLLDDYIYISTITAKHGPCSRTLWRERCSTPIFSAISPPFLIRRHPLNPSRHSSMRY